MRAPYRKQRRRLVVFVPRVLDDVDLHGAFLDDVVPHVLAAARLGAADTRRHRRFGGEAAIIRNLNSR